MSSRGVAMLRFPPRKQESHRYERRSRGGWDPGAAQKFREVFYTHPHVREVGSGKPQGRADWQSSVNLLGLILGCRG